MQADLAAIAIDPIGDRLGHYLGDELIYELNGTGSQVAPKYRLTVTVREHVQTPLVDTLTRPGDGGDRRRQRPLSPGPFGRRRTDHRRHSFCRGEL